MSVACRDGLVQVAASGPWRAFTEGYAFWYRRWGSRPRPGYHDGLRYQVGRICTLQLHHQVSAGDFVASHFCTRAGVAVAAVADSVKRCVRLIGGRRCR